MALRLLLTTGSRCWAGRCCSVPVSFSEALGEVCWVSLEPLEVLAVALVDHGVSVSLVPGGLDSRLSGCHSAVALRAVFHVTSTADPAGHWGYVALRHCQVGLAGCPGSASLGPRQLRKLSQCCAGCSRAASHVGFPICFRASRGHCEGRASQVFESLGREELLVSRGNGWSPSQSLSPQPLRASRRSGRRAEMERNSSQQRVERSLLSAWVKPEASH